MNISAWQLYWITRLDQVSCFFDVFFIVLTLILVGSLIFNAAICSEDFNYCDNCSKSTRGWDLFKLRVKICYPIAWIWLIITTLSCFVPTSKEMAAFIVIPRVANSERVQQIPSKVLDLANEWLETLRPKQEENK